MSGLISSSLAPEGVVDWKHANSRVAKQSSAERGPRPLVCSREDFLCQIAIDTSFLIETLLDHVEQFHYRQMRRKEQDRLSRMDADYQRRKETTEFSMRREERLKAAEERTAKKRLKRQKKKQKKKEKKSKTSGDGEEDGEENQKEESSDNEVSDYNDDELRP